MGKKGGWKERRCVEGKVDVNFWEEDVLEGGRIKTESKERDTLTEGTIMRLARNLTLGKFPGIYKDDPR